MSDSTTGSKSNARPTLALCCMVLVGCMQTPATVSADRPDWLSTEPAEYPNNVYLSATGSADDQERAKDRALANLSKIFETRIRESSTAISDVQSRKVDGAESVTNTQRLRRNIQVETDKILDGARIAEQWYDRTEISHHALAVMDRRQAGNNLRSEMQRLDEETALELERAASAGDALQRVAQLTRAIGNQQQRAALQKTLKVIDLRGQGDPSRWNMAELRQQMESALNSMKMAVAISNDDLGGLAALVSGAMSHGGFPASASGYEYVIASSVKLEPSFENQGWHWLRGQLQLTLTDASGRVMGNRSWPVKVSSVQPGLLKPRMAEVIEKTLKDDLRDAILGFAQGDI